MNRQLLQMLQTAAKIALPLFICFLLFLVWASAAPWGCWALFFPLVVLFVISYSFIDARMHRRLCYRDCFFNTKSFIARILSSKFFITIVALIVSSVLTVSSMLLIVALPTAMWIYIAMHIILMQLLYDKLKSWSVSVVNPGYRSIFAREWSIHIGAVPIILAAVLVSYYGYEPAYLRDSWQATLTAATNAVHSDCRMIDYTLRINNEINALFWWTMEQGNTLLQNDILRTAMWLLFLLNNALACLGINRFIGTVIYLIDKKRQGEAHAE